MVIADARCAWLTTLRRDGSPHTTPVWFLLAGETFWVASATGNVKVRNLRHDARASIAVDGTGDRPHVAQGRALLHDAPNGFSHVVAGFAVKYDGWDVTDEGQDGPRVLIEIPVAGWLLAIH